MNFRLAIREKLFFSILLAILVSYSILLLLTVRNIETSFKEKIAKDLETNLRFVRYQLFSSANQIKYALLVPASRPKTKGYLRQRNTEELVGVLNSIKVSLPFLKFAAFVDQDMKVLASISNRRNGYVFELGGIVETAFRKREPILSCEKAPPSLLYQEDAGGSASPVKNTEDILITAVAIPIINDNGEVLGALVGGVPITKNILVPYPLQESFGNDLEVSLTRRDLKSIGGAEDVFDIPPASIAQIIPVLRQGKIYRGEVQVGSTIYKAAIEPITNVKGEFIGSLSVALPKEYVNKLRKDNFGSILMSAVIGAIISFLIAYLVSRRLAVPLKELTKGVRCIAAGNLDYRVVIETNDDFGVLAGSFNKMADSLRERDVTIKNKAFDLEVLNRCLHEMNELLESKVLERTAELEVEKGRLEAILASMAEGVVVTDREHRVILFNSAAQRIFGIAPYKIIGLHVENIDVKEDFHKLVLGIRDVGTGDLLARGEKDVTIGGKKLRVGLAPLLDQSWEFAGVVMSIRDVTHEEEVDRMKREFISTVSHELKTPLTSMKGSLQVILGRGEGMAETERELLQVCLRNTDRLIRLIRDILDISKMESGKVKFNLRPESIGSAVVGAIEEVAGFARDRSVSVQNSIENDLPPVLADHDRLVQVLTNLLSNAVKFSPSGKEVTVSAQRDKDFLIVSVQDLGKTIERVDRDKLFQRFPQLQSSDARERGGTGLGLAICSEIIQQHHGRIWYSPGKGCGNVFNFTVPVCGEEK